MENPLDNTNTPTDNILPHNTDDEHSNVTLNTEIKMEELNDALKSANHAKQ